jgi:hypothetical protein
MKAFLMPIIGRGPFKFAGGVYENSVFTLGCPDFDWPDIIPWQRTLD